MAVLQISFFHFTRKGEDSGRNYLPRAYARRFQVRYYEYFNPIVIFIDTKPAISWRRRKNRYLARIKNIKGKKQKQIALRKYRENINRLYPVWLSVYQKLPFPKYLINNSFKSKKEFLQQIKQRIDFMS